MGVFEFFLKIRREKRIVEQNEDKNSSRFE